LTPSAVIFNPSKAADPVRARREIGEALLANGFADPEWLETTEEEPGTSQCRQALADGCEVVFVSGGDGTVRACIEALAGTDVRLAVLPAGTGNLLARNFDIPQTLGDAVVVAAKGHTRRVDVGVSAGGRFAIMAGMGFDAEMLADAPEQLKAKVGWPAYVVSAARHLREPRHTFTLTVDGAVPLTVRGRGVLVGNVGRLQGGLPVLPDATPDDGRLDVAVIRAGSLAGWAVLAVSVALRRRSRRLQTFQARTVVIECDERLPTELDGEVVGDNARLEVRVEPHALLLLVPS
jgi:YegS/Rv2252/BmrU family lipid kinase